MPSPKPAATPTSFSSPFKPAASPATPPISPTTFASPIRVSASRPRWPSPRTGLSAPARWSNSTFTWTPTTQNERFPKCEADLTGRTAQATGLSTSVITAVLGVKVRPIVLGHYLMLEFTPGLRATSRWANLARGAYWRQRPRLPMRLRNTVSPARDRRLQRRCLHPCRQPDRDPRAQRHRSPNRASPSSTIRPMNSATEPSPPAFKDPPRMPTAAPGIYRVRIR